MTKQAIDPQAVDAIVEQFDARPEMLVQILVAIVKRHGWISPAVIRHLADALNLSRAEVHGVVEFYHDFRTRPPGRHIVKVCQAEACQSMGSRALVDHAHSRADDDITVEAVYCLGNCACAPAVMVDDRAYGRVDPERFDALLAAAREARQ
ncbi:MAG: NAD(P)H-dependent oxidoreductase subunit E [Woeseiaceae bacterium]